MFAPRPELAVAEMRRVLKPSGRVAFATWPPESLVGRMFKLIARGSPPLPPGIAPPVLWGDPDVVAKRLTGAFEKLSFERGTMTVPALSLAHYRLFMERSVGPMQKLVENLTSSPKQLEAVRREFDAIAQQFYADNLVSQEYLLTRADAR